MTVSGIILLSDVLAFNICCQSKLNSLDRLKLEDSVDSQSRFISEME